MNEYRETLPGIVCDAKNCEYHTFNNECSAKEIKVENRDACSSSETECHTFIPKNS